MKLIGSLTSPFVRKVRVVLAEKKIECEFEIDSPWTPETNVPNINPLGKIPVLVLDDETLLFDSRVISEYLDNVAPNNKLMPAPNRERTEVKRWEALADGVCDAAVAALLESRRQPPEQSTTWIAPKYNRAPSGLPVNRTKSSAESTAWPNSSERAPGAWARISRWQTSVSAVHSAIWLSVSRKSTGARSTPISVAWSTN